MKKIQSRIKTETRPIKKTPSKEPEKSLQLKSIIESSLEDDKAQDIVSIPLAGKSDMADYLVIATGTSSRHIGSIATKLMHKIRDSGLAGSKTEGFPDCEWVIVDNPLVIVHIFKPEVRRHYNLEKMWEAEFPGPAAQ